MRIVAQNYTGSLWEQYVDFYMSGVEYIAADFVEYANSPQGKTQIAQVELISTVASAVILGLASPFTVGLSAFAGAVIKSFSPEQLESVSDSFGKISDKLPAGVKMLAVVITLTYLRILFPVSAGLYLGLYMLPHIPGSTVAGVFDTVNGKLPFKGASSAIQYNGCGRI